jgi:hypothetical protein
MIPCKQFRPWPVAKIRLLITQCEIFSCHDYFEVSKVSTNFLVRYSLYNLNTIGLHVICMSHSWIWYFMLWSIERRADKCVILSTNVAAPCNHHVKNSDWEPVAQRRTIARLWALFKEYSGETGLESYTRQVAKALLFEYCWSCSEN